MCANCRRPKLPIIARLGRAIGNLNDRLYRGRPERWAYPTWRFVDRIAGRMYVWGER